MSNLLIRPVKIDDLNPILSLLEQLNTKMSKDENEDQSHMLRVLHQILENHDYYVIVSEIAGRIVGTATLLIQRNLSHGGKPYAHIENVVTDENFRQQGIGQKMINVLLEHARKTGCYKTILNCSKKNAYFYRKCGFEFTDEIEMRIDF